LSEQGRLDFLAAEGLEDWVVLHGGPTAVYRTASLAEAASLANAIAQIPELNGTRAQLNVVSERLTVRLTREVWNIESEHIALARDISKVAASHGVVAEPHQVQEVQIAIAAKPDAIDLGFWRAVLGYEPMLEDNAIDPLGNSSVIWMQELEASKDLQHAMHLDVSVAKENAQMRVVAAIDAGGVLIDDSHAPAWWTLSDRSGNKVCIVSWPDGSVNPQEQN
jgi:4a-hydroxytetrahydrobiopterin dehydratase